jgi:hypothetical protein
VVEPLRAIADDRATDPAVAETAAWALNVLRRGRGE